MNKATEAVYRSDQLDTYRLTQQAKDRVRYPLKYKDRAPKTYKNADGEIISVRTAQPVIDWAALAELAKSLA